MKATKDTSCDSVALCAISSGIFGFPKVLCAKLIIDCIIDLSEETPDLLPAEIRITNSDQPTVEVCFLLLSQLLFIFIFISF